MKPPAPKPVSGLSAANEVRTAQTAASTALPPSRRIAAPASAVSGLPAATTPCRLMRRSVGLAGEELRDFDAELVGAAPAAPRGLVLGAGDRRLGGAAQRRGAAVEAGR